MDGDPIDCIYLEFDENFPFENKIDDVDERQNKIFEIIKKCAIYGTWPPPISSEINNINSIPKLNNNKCENNALKYNFDDEKKPKIINIRKKYIYV